MGSTHHRMLKVEHADEVRPLIVNEEVCSADVAMDDHGPGPNCAR